MPESEESRWGSRTDWDVVRAAGLGADDAWSQLLRRYGDLIDTALQRRLRGRSVGVEAGDLMRDFFTFLFEEGVVQKADPARGRFRCYLQVVLRRYAGARLREQAGRAGQELRESDAQVLDGSELEQEEEREWALNLLRNAFHRLLEDKERDGQMLLRAYGIPPFQSATRESLAADFEMSVQAVNTAIHRARQSLGAIIDDLARESVDPIACSAVDIASEVSLVRRRLLEARPELFRPD